VLLSRQMCRRHTIFFWRTTIAPVLIESAYTPWLLLGLRPRYAFDHRYLKGAVPFRVVAFRLTYRSSTMNDNTLQPTVPYSYCDTPAQGWGCDWEVDHELVDINTGSLDDSINTAYKWLGKLAWQIRRIEAGRFNGPLMQVSWRRCLLLAAIINDRRRNQNSWLVTSIKQRAWLGESALIGC